MSAARWKEIADDLGLAQQLPGPPAPEAFDVVWPPVVCGVYFLVAGERIVYVGQSTDIHERVHAHRRTKPRFDRVIAIPVADTARGSFRVHDTIERVLIDALSPEWNGNKGRTADPITRHLWESWLGIDTARGAEALLRWLLS
jgi:hypothetical protein